jgi:hypothetical protein
MCDQGLAKCVAIFTEEELCAKGLTVQWQRPLAGEYPPRVQSLGAAQFVKKTNLLAGPVCQSTGQGTVQVDLRIVCGPGRILMGYVS